METMEGAIAPGESRPPRPRVPASTYRLQLRAGFGFRDAEAVVPYLDRLGISACYCSPYFAARPGSTHGYDICDFGRLNPELGSEAEYGAFASALAAREMGQILDFVPNHMAADPDRNPWWRDLIENGPSSPYARFFDVDWAPLKSELEGKILLPFLGDHYGLILERGELQLAIEGGGLVVRYGDASFPIDPRLLPRVFRAGLEAVRDELGGGNPHLREFFGILADLERLPVPADTAPRRTADRIEGSRALRGRLADLFRASPRLLRHAEEAIARANGVPGKPESFDALHELLEDQPYRLAYWKTAIHEINFRRFFDVNHLAGLRMEDPAVFDAAHGLVLRLIREGKVTGLRLDHIDGLFDPLAYLEMLQGAIREGRAGEDARFYVVVEKILTGGEAIPADWPVAGTTGYDFLNDLNRLFVDPRGAQSMKRTYARFTRRRDPFDDVAYEGKEVITWTSLASELNVLADALNRISEGDRRARDFTLDGLRECLREVASCFPVYRTYVRDGPMTESDRQVVDLAIERARRRNPAMEPSAFDFLRGSLLPDRDALAKEGYRARLRFAMKFQQYTGPLQAKGVEDTAFYRDNALLSPNEVGGDPARPAAPPAQFHKANRRRYRATPRAMLATSTHDTKRGEDARARINALSELPDEWRRQVVQWARINAGNRADVEGKPAPDRNDEYLFYQTLVGCWPAIPGGAPDEGGMADLIGRLRGYMEKAVREAKVHSSWINPNEGYDRAVASFVESTLAGPTAPRFLAEFLPFQQRIARLGLCNSLAQVILKVISPGVPDFYQGAELWDLNLVDPDNRRPVDFALRSRLLGEIEPWLGGAPADIAGMLEHWEDGRIKLFATASGLRLRKGLPRLFLDGGYLPLEAEGELAEHVVAAARVLGELATIAVAPRLVAGLCDDEHPLPIGPSAWGSARLTLPPPLDGFRYRDVLTGTRHRPAAGYGPAGLDLSVVLGACPVALLVADPG
jgi:(1->4)-alpha-D-glucan 1-alpha-D-glucosylmutase